jgi:hypothetical protein
MTNDSRSAQMRAPCAIEALFVRKLQFRLQSITQRRAPPQYARRTHFFFAEGKLTETERGPSDTLPIGRFRSFRHGS